MSNNLKLVKAFPVLYGEQKQGKTKTWTIACHTQGNHAVALTSYGQVDGAIQTSSRTYTEGKNIGKKNETTPLDQCLKESERKWLDKIEKEGYKEKLEPSIEEEKESFVIYPMLAQTYEPESTKKKKKTIEYPCFLQPKLDGLRCLMYFDPAQKKVVAQSRTGSLFTTVEHITTELTGFLYTNPSLVVDGELYTTNYPFEQLAGLIKKKKLAEDDSKLLEKVKYHIYDLYDRNSPTLPYEVRLEKIEANFPISSYDCVVQTEEVDSVEDFFDWFALFVQDGYEGIILRNKKGRYECNFRSHDLQKYKEFEEDEFEITGFKEADGRDKGTVVWECITPDGILFSVRPKGTLEQRKEWFEKGKEYVGQKLTVIYQNLTEDKVPRFPVGKAIRSEY